jgi:hypothetical protein
MALALLGALLGAEPDCQQDGRPFHWIHVPKSGSAFLNLVVRAGCPEAVRRVGERKLETSQFLKAVKEAGCQNSFVNFHDGHFALPARHTPAHAAVCMIRNPLDRVVSGFFHFL